MLIRTVSRQPSAVRLFIARLAAQRPGREYQSELSASIVAICRRLDGIPLAIEFAAAAQCDLLTLGIEEVLSRLDDRFSLLISGRRTALAKHRTLRAAFDWSYDLLSDSERLLLRRLAIFSSAFSLAAASLPSLVTTRPRRRTSRTVSRNWSRSRWSRRISALSSCIIACLRRRKPMPSKDCCKAKGPQSRLQPRHAEYYQKYLERIEDQHPRRECEPLRSWQHPRGA